MQWRFIITSLCCPQARSCECKMIADTTKPCANSVRVSLHYTLKVPNTREPWKTRFMIKYLLYNTELYNACFKVNGGHSVQRCRAHFEGLGQVPHVSKQIQVMLHYHRGTWQSCSSDTLMEDILVGLQSGEFPGRVVTFSRSCEKWWCDAHKADTSSAPVTNSAGCVCHHSRLTVMQWGCSRNLTLKNGYTKLPSCQEMMWLTQCCHLLATAEQPKHLWPEHKERSELKELVMMSRAFH